MIPLRAPPAIFLGKDTSAHELASISSASILVELADSEALASLVDTSLPVQEEAASQSVSCMPMPLHRFP